MLLGPEAKEELRFCQTLQTRPRALSLLDSHMIMATDESKSVWSAKDHWMGSDQDFHINILEMKAVFNGLRAFHDKLKDKIVSVQIDNQTVVSFLTKEGGTRSPRLSRLTRDVLLGVWSRT